MLLGAFPVRDFVERGIPLMSATSAAGQVVFGHGLLAELTVVSLAFAVSAALLTVVAGRVGGSIVSAVMAALVAVLVYPAAYSYPKILAYALVFAAGTLYCARPARVTVALLAASVVVAFLFRHDHGFILAGGVVVMLVAFHGFSGAGAGAVARFALVGMLLVSPYLLWVQAYEGLGAYFADGIAFSQREAERASWWDPPAFAIDRSRPLFQTIGGGPVINVRWAPEATNAVIREGERQHRLIRLDPVGPQTWQYELRSWTSAALERLVRDPAVADTQGLDRSKFLLEVPAPRGLRRLLVGHRVPAEGLRLRSNAVAAMFYLCWAMPLIAAVALYRRRAEVPPASRSLVLMAIAVQIAMNVSMLRDPLDLRVRDIVAPFAVLLAFVAGAAAATGRGHLRVWAARAGAVLLLAIVLGVAAALGPLDEHLSEMKALAGFEGITQRLAEIRDELRPPRERTGRVSATNEQLAGYLRDCTPPDARLLSLTFAPELFFYSGRGFAGGQVTVTPGYFVTDRHATLMLERLARENVPLVIMDSETQGQIAIHYGRVMQHVNQRYDEVGRFPVGTGKDLILLADAGRAALRQYGPKQLPCYVS
jgi:hypothetical protein